MDKPSSSPAALSRRSVLSAAALAATAAAIGRSQFAAARHPAAAAPAADARRRVLRFAHPTDIHVQPELHGGEGMATCFRHMMALSDRPELIITGGDLPMDTASTPETTSRVQWELFTKVLADTVPREVTVEHTLGNHDIFGRNKEACGATGSEAFYGKRWFLDNFGYASTYRSFDRAGWHFVILDSIDLLPDGDEYVARLGPAQMQWLKADLEATGGTRPTVIVTHVPIVSVANFFDKNDILWRTEGPDLTVSTKRMHTDLRQLDTLFQQHRNVKLCLSGHLHLLDRCEYNGVSYICDGAVSGAKWRGPKRQTDEGYGLIDLYSDGTFDHRYTKYGWSAERKAKPEKTGGEKSAAKKSEE